MQNLKHILMMAAGCLLPILFLLVAPRLGISSNWAVGVAIAGMLACHLLMPMHHKKHHDGSKKQSNEIEGT